MISNFFCDISRDHSQLANEDTHHAALSCDLKLFAMVGQPFALNFPSDPFNFRKTSFLLLYSSLCSIDWLIFDIMGDVDESVISSIAFLDKYLKYRYLNINRLHAVIDNILCGIVSISSLY